MISYDMYVIFGGLTAMYVLGQQHAKNEDGFISTLITLVIGVLWPGFIIAAIYKVGKHEYRNFNDKTKNTD